jgi:hypothetical protein
MSSPSRHIDNHYDIQAAILIIQKLLLLLYIICYMDTIIYVSEIA